MLPPLGGDRCRRPAAGDVAELAGRRIATCISRDRRDGVTFSKPEKLGTGTWQLNACPMDGGGLDVSGGRIITAWRRGEDVFLDEPGRAEKRIGAGKDVALATSGDRTYVAWTNGVAIELWNGGKIEVLAKTGAFPSLVSLTHGGVLAAWEEDGGIQIRRLP